MTIDEMKKKKQELGYSLKQIAELSGLPLGTVNKIFNGETKSPRFETLMALEKALNSHPSNYYTADSSEYRTDSIYVEEALPVYNTTNKSDYSIEDYYRLPSEKRFELIDGTLYNMSAPSTIHQLILSELFVRLYNCIKDHCSKEECFCKVYLSPCDVLLGEDYKTVVQPDLFVLCEPSKDTGKRIEGAPDFIIEIISESTIGKDSVVKLNKYMHSGVKEYWIVDPLNKAVLVYLFGDKTAFYSYTFEDKVPVHISGGRCIIDFSDIMAG